MKFSLTDNSILRIDDLNLEIDTNVSTICCGAVLLQKYNDEFYPICDFSAQITKIESRFHSSVLEMVVIIKALN